MTASFPLRSLLVALALLVAAMPAPAGAALRERPDATWMTDGKVYALARAGDALFIGGSFTQLLPPRGSDAAPIEVRNLAALHVRTGRPLEWAPRVGGVDPAVHTLAVADGRVYIGGRFSRLNDAGVSNVGAVAIDDGRTIGSFRPKVGGPVYALLATPTRLFAGGAFGKVDGARRAKLAAWDLPSGGLSQRWRPATAWGAVRDLAFDAGDGSIVVAGAFEAMTQAGVEHARKTMAKVDADSGRLRPWSPRRVRGDPQAAWDVVARGSGVHAGFGRRMNFAASFDARGRVAARRWRLRTEGNVQAVELSSKGSRLYLGGHFGLNGTRQRLCGREVRGLLSVRVRSGEPYCDWMPRLAPSAANFHGPWAILSAGNAVWVAGGWANIGGKQQSNIARFSAKPH